MTLGLLPQKSDKILCWPRTQEKFSADVQLLWAFRQNSFKLLSTVTLTS